MDTYSLLREFADSWALLFLFCFFIGVIVWAFWPSLSADRQDAAQIPFRNDTPAASGCAGDCENCKCDNLVAELKGLIDV